MFYNNFIYDIFYYFVYEVLRFFQSITFFVRITLFMVYHSFYSLSFLCFFNAELQLESLFYGETVNVYKQFTIFFFLIDFFD